MMIRRLSGLAWLAIGTLAFGAPIAGCGGSAQVASVPQKVKKTASIPKVGRNQSPEEVPGILVLATGTLSGSGKFAIFLEPSETNKDTSVEYSLMMGDAEPVRYEPPHPPSWRVHNGMVWGKAGGRMVVGREGAVVMTVIDGCTGPYPHRVVWGLLKSRRDTVTAYTDHRRIRFKTAVLPRQLHASSVAVYALLPPRAGGYIITRTPSGRMVNEESLPAPNEVGKCGV